MCINTACASHWCTESSGDEDDDETEAEIQRKVRNRLLRIEKEEFLRASPCTFIITSVYYTECRICTQEIQLLSSVKKIRTYWHILAKEAFLVFIMYSDNHVYYELLCQVVKQKRAIFTGRSKIWRGPSRVPKNL